MDISSLLCLTINFTFFGETIQACFCVVFVFLVLLCSDFFSKSIFIYLIEKEKDLFRARKGWIELEAWRIANTHCKVSGKVARYTREQQSVGLSFTVAETNACPHFKIS